MTRAWVHALALRIPDAFGYNPVFWIVPFILFFCWYQKRHPLIPRIGLAVCLSIMLVAYGIRMADPTDTIVVFAPPENILYQIYHAIVTQFQAW